MSNSSMQSFSAMVLLLIGLPLCQAKGQLGGATSSSYEITVHVEDAKGNPLPNASISSPGTDGSFTTDALGVAKMRTSISPSIISIRSIGYSEQNVYVKPRNGEVNQLRVILRPITSLDTISIIAKAPLTRDLERRRQQGGSGTFYGTEEVAKSFDLKSLIVRSRGVNLVPWSGRFAVQFQDRKGGHCYANVYIDGMLAYDPIGAIGRPKSLDDGLKMFDDVRSLSSDAVAAMEVYPNVGQAPQNVVRLLDGCGVILIWTKGYVNARLPRETRGNQ